jgi:hypothetical protein
MANEITLSATLQLSNGLLTPSARAQRIQADQSAANANAGTQSIGTTHESIDMGGVSSAGYCYIRNIDDDNFIEIGLEVSAAFAPFAKLLPGEVALFRAGGTLYAKADTAAATIDVLILDT